jgi:hypothetical protein
VPKLVSIATMKGTAIEKSSSASSDMLASSSSTCTASAIHVSMLDAGWCFQKQNNKINSPTDMATHTFRVEL